VSRRVLIGETGGPDACVVTDGWSRCSQRPSSRMAPWLIAAYEGGIEALGAA